MKYLKSTIILLFLLLSTSKISAQDNNSVVLITETKEYHLSSRGPSSTYDIITYSYQSDSNRVEIFTDRAGSLGDDYSIEEAILLVHIIIDKADESHIRRLCHYEDCQDSYVLVEYYLGLQ